MANSWVKMGTPTVAGGGGGGGGLTVTKQLINAEIVLFDQILTVDTANFVADLTLEPLYSSCKDLKIITQLRSILTGTPYAYSSMRPNGAVDNSGQFMQRLSIRAAGVVYDIPYTFYSEHASDDGPSNSFTIGYGYLLDFNHATKRKFIQHTTAGVDAASGAYRTNQTEFVNDLGITAPITQLELLATDYNSVATGSFKAGSRLTIYGTLELEVVTDVS